MKLEKVTENSIELTVETSDLAKRNMTTSDLKYGTDKVNKLILELINMQDVKQCFKADCPLSVEAVPLKDGEIKFIINKIINPDELDVRYSKFTPTKSDYTPVNIMKMIEQTVDRFEEALRASNIKGVHEVNSGNKLEIKKESDVVCIFEFDNIDKASDACKNISTFDYISVFYKDEKNKKFYLVLSEKQDVTEECFKEFNRVCNTLAEYGKRIDAGFGMNQAYYAEHYKVVIKEDAVKKLCSL